MTNMNNERLAEIRARVEAATPGPWNYDGMHPEILTPRGDDFWLIISALREHPGDTTFDKYGHTYNADFEFIAEARQDIPDLLDHINQQRARIEGLEQRLATRSNTQITHHCPDCERLARERDAAVIVKKKKLDRRCSTCMHAIWLEQSDGILMGRCRGTPEEITGNGSCEWWEPERTEGNG